jgi:hypothetical protein
MTLGRITKLLTGAAMVLGVALSETPAFAQSVDFQGSTFINQGLVGVARVPSSARDKYGDTLGGFGSAIAFQPGSWKFNKKTGTYTANLVTVPDRGWNTQGTLDYRGRTQTFKIQFTPYYGAATTTFQNQLVENYQKLTALHHGKPTTGLDAVKVIPAANGFPDLPAGENGRLSVDNEGIVIQNDGTFWISDEYGPYVYHYAKGGKLLNAIRPPEAFIPRRLINGQTVENFSANSPPIGETYNLGNPVSGRQNNQGLEGLSISPDQKTLYVLLQSALIQDLNVADIKHTRRNTRLLAYDISDAANPQLIHEYVVQLPTYQDPSTATPSILIAAQSEVHALNDHQFLVLARDSSVGETFPATPGSVYRSIDLIDTTGATDIANTAADAVTGSIAPNGVLNSGIVPVAYQPFLNMDDNAQLGRFGLHNGAPADSNDLYEKWESLAIEPVNDPAAPNDYFLFVASDNDFVTKTGFMNGQPYTDAFDADMLTLVYRVTLPTYVPPSP